MITKQKNRWAIVGTVFTYIGLMLLVVFIVLHFRAWWQGPKIYIKTPVAGQELSKSITTIQGHVSNLARLYVNGLLIPISIQDNTFMTQVSLPDGYSVIGLDGYARSGRHTRRLIPVFYRAEKIPAKESDFINPDYTKTLELIEVLDKN